MAHWDGYRRRRWALHLIVATDLGWYLFMAVFGPIKTKESFCCSSKHAEKMGFEVSDGYLGSIHRCTKERWQNNNTIIQNEPWPWHNQSISEKNQGGKKSLRSRRVYITYAYCNEKQRSGTGSILRLRVVLANLSSCYVERVFSSWNKSQMQWVIMIKCSRI